MIARLFFALSVFLAASARAEPLPPLVPETPGVSYLHEALDRLHTPYERLPTLTAEGLAPGRLLVLAGKDLSLGDGASHAVETFLQQGGRMLALGGGARWMLKQKLFDATGYYPTGTTIHQSRFDGYHRLTFGYPGEKPHNGWTYGVPMLLRATGGPLMTPGPHSISVLGAGGPFSLAAFQRYGPRGGLALLVGPDPQGGDQYLALDKPTPTRGDTLGTDGLLQNALAWLVDPSASLIPNGGFEECTKLPPAQSHWDVTERFGGTHEFAQAEAPEGKTFLQLTGNQPKSEVHAKLYLPVVVEPGSQYKLTLLYRATGGAAVKMRYVMSAESSTNATEPALHELPAAPAWHPYVIKVTVPDTHHLVELEMVLNGAQQLGLDDVRLCLVAGGAD